MQSVVYVIGYNINMIEKMEKFFYIEYLQMMLEYFIKKKNYLMMHTGLTAVMVIGNYLCLGQPGFLHVVFLHV